ncbi:TPM domain-containing protein [Pseudomonas sp. DTU_2021_1001937_2_SI_NGA_ILE_001]|uniref:TPM domain-containing protein n=1 Tax=Pseudomonas sp. DTU_2021_1001937_2_SI_NGA_ILE_001 TaxID=3077589 RepID=UPI0025DC9F90|nr:TPM domain-containing protein [Pseudomonas sp. DTU_2021_1001937_2_SI_NGA_ILE_001]WNW11609.1 TPM domain-containing protein [Pseudomonas sp. DTU_2021_1001937_2_SI_NGA_ILE_001]
MALLSEDEQRQVAEAIAHIEQRTDAELVAVLAARADDYAYVPLVWAGAMALLGPGLFNYCTGWLSANQLLLAQLVTFVGIALVCRIPRVTARLVPSSVRRWRAGNLARRQFFEQNLHTASGGTGILLFVCEAERYVEILVDYGISSRLSDETWKAMVDVFTQQMRNGQNLNGFLGCLRACDELLAYHLPATRGHSELSNRLVVLS